MDKIINMLNKERLNLIEENKVNIKQVESFKRLSKNAEERYNENINVIDKIENVLRSLPEPNIKEPSI